MNDEVEGAAGVGYWFPLPDGLWFFMGVIFGKNWIAKFGKFG